MPDCTSTSLEQAVSVESSADLCFACVWLAVNCSKSGPGLMEARVICALGMGHTAGPGNFVSLSSVSVLAVSQHHEMGWTCSLFINLLVK